MRSAAYRRDVTNRALTAVMLAWAIGTGNGAAMAEPASTGEPRSYHQVRDFLQQHSRVIELTAADGSRVAICPEYQGRIMTSSFADVQGPSLGWVNFEFIRAGQQVPAFNNYGGEDRFWLAPEGGQFGLFFSLGLTQVVQNWLTPPEINTGSFHVESSDEQSCRLTRRVRVANAAEASFDVAVEHGSCACCRRMNFDNSSAIRRREQPDSAARTQAVPLRRL